MAMPSSGCISLLACISGVNCSSISCSVCNTSTGPQSLNNLGTLKDGGTGGAKSMSDFYGYDNFTVLPSTMTNISASCVICSVTIDGSPRITYTTSDVCTWLNPAAPSAICAGGSSHLITICQNTGAARSGVVCYIPSYGTQRDITFCQVAGACPLYFTSLYNCVCTCCAVRCARLDGLCSGQCVGLTAGYVVDKRANSTGCVVLTCAGTVARSCCVTATGTYSLRANFTSIVVPYCSTCSMVCMCYRGTVVTPAVEHSCVGFGISSITNCVGSYSIGSPLGFEALVGTPPM